MAEQDGQPVATPSEGEVAPVVEAKAETPDINEVVAKAVAEALKSKEQETSRKIQSETDKRVAPFQKRLSEAERRAQMLEDQLRNLPNAFGDADPEIRQRAQLASLQGQVGYYRTREQFVDQERVIQEAKQSALADTKAEIEALGIDPEDSRLEFDLDAADAVTFRRKAFASVRSIQKAEREKEKADNDARLAKTAADLEAKIRKDSGVDSQDSTGSASGKETFSKAQFLDRKFYKEHKEAMEKAVREGRIQD